MERKNSVKTALLIAVIFFIIKFLLDMLLFYCEPMQRLFRQMHYGDLMRNEKLSSITVIISTVVLLIALLPKCILAFYNMNQKDMQKQRGLMTIILTAAFSVLSSVISIISTPIIHWFTSSNETVLLATLSRLRSVTGLFSTSATIILYCCGAIELYNGTEKPTYPPYNGGINNNENNLS